MSQKILDLLRAELGPAILETHSEHGDDTAVVDAARWREIALFLRDDPRTAMDAFVDLTAVDYRGRQQPRFEVVLHLRSSQRLHRVRIKARLDDPSPNDASPGPSPGPSPKDGSEPTIASLVSVWPGANWFERETYDMFGIRFAEHPDLRRILMYDEFEGYPLRKDYAAERTQPLIAYREDAPGKLPPFGPSEGMPFGRQTHAQSLVERCPGPSPSPSDGLDDEDG